MSKPKRIQRKRTKGWRMPPNTIYVGRPSKWGNPYDWNTSLNPVTEYELDIEEGKRSAKEIKREFKGKNLACWCPLDQPCHADILLKIAND